MEQKKHKSVPVAQTAGENLPPIPDVVVRQLCPRRREVGLATAPPSPAPPSLLDKHLSLTL